MDENISIQTFMKTFNQTFVKAQLSHSFEFEDCTYLEGIVSFTEDKLKIIKDDYSFIFIPISSIKEIYQENYDSDMISIELKYGGELTLCPNNDFN